MNIPEKGDFTDKIYTYKYPHPAVTADCCIFAFLKNELSILLIRRGIEPYKDRWALPGGFMRMDETAEQCALRELHEETRYFAESLRQFRTYSGVNRDPRERVVTVAFYALVKMGRVCGGDDAAEARWFPVSQLPDLAFDHVTIVNDALLAMRRDVYFEPIGFELLPPTFSMRELQKIIETITGETYDRRNFYNKMRHMQFVTEVGEKSRSEERDFHTANMSSPHFDEYMPQSVGSCDVAAESILEEEYEAGFAREPKRVISGLMAPTHEEKPEKPKKVSRRSGVRYSFNALAFKKRKDKKGSGPITY